MTNRFRATCIDTWPTTTEATFGLPPLEFCRSTHSKDWRGVRFGDVVSELYYEIDGFRDDFQIKEDYLGNTCAATGKPPYIPEFALSFLHQRCPHEILWNNIIRFMPLSDYTSSFLSPKAHNCIVSGLTNAVDIKTMKYEDFYVPHDEKRVLGNVSNTLILAVSYAHKSKNAIDGLLKANESQIAQLKDILEALRRKPPKSTKFVRLWCDQVLSQRLQSMSDRPSWILYGLVPYALYPVISLHSGDDTDSLSMWSACEHILSDGGKGCMFSTKSSHRKRLPEFCKKLYTVQPGLEVLKTVGDGLSLNENIRKLAAIIHSGLLDETVTYHIYDAQQLIR